ncbi:hypothetical protein QQF64_016543 [Cirrhinus molitorella]|uniref:Gypsy retrotransposon integrase-like protein 1 n=1 Tax=Cirrhinus molitorella TaxID=172907 RepID=A0ABR3LN27_9TELE
MPGKKLLPVGVGASQTGHEFWLADIRDDCIIGLDLLAHWGACVDVLEGKLCLRDKTVPLWSGQNQQRKVATLQSQYDHQSSPVRVPSQQLPSPQVIPASPSPETVAAVEELGQQSGSHLNRLQQEQLQQLLQEFMDIFAAREEDCTRTALVQHHIDTGHAAPIRLRPHRLPLAKRQAAEELIRDMAANGIIEPSDSPWAAPIVMVRKKQGGWRPCVDFRRLNAVTRKDSYPLPRIDDALDYVAGSGWFSSLDLRSGYWQVELAPEVRPKTAFTIGHGLWQFRVMPFGLCNAPATFERLMERVLKDIPRTRCVVYLDDLLVHAQDFDQAVHNLREVLTAIRSAGLRLNPAKCNLLARKTQFLGHVVSESGVATDPAKRNERGERVVAYYSCSLSRPERNYCVTRRELLAVVLAVRHFRPYLLGTKFTLRTDHASLTWMLNFRQPEGQVARWLEILQEYDFEIQHRPGRQHANADALSRRPCLSDECCYCSRQEERGLQPSSAAAELSDTGQDGELFTTEQLRQQQVADRVLVEVRGWLESRTRPDWQAVSSEGPELKTFHSQWGSLELHDGVLYRRWQAPGEGIDRLQLLVPKALRPQVLRWVHGAVGSGHFGTAKTVRRLRQRFYWPGCRQEAELHVHCCDVCTAQKGPIQRSRAPLQQYLVGAPMERIGVDILGPFPVLAIRLVDEMFTRFGVPDELHSDQGRNFESRLFSEVCQRLGVKKTRTTPLHPQSDGLVERFNRTLATQLAILTSQHQRDWDQHLPLVLWAYRTAVQESSQCTPAALMFGRELRTPVDLVFGSAPEPEIEGGPELEYFRRLKERLNTVHQLAREALENAGARQKRAYDARAHGPTFTPGDKVWVFCPQRKRGLSPKLTHHWQGPGEVLNKISEVVFRVYMPGGGRRVVLHKDRLAPYRPLAPRQEAGSHLTAPSTERDNDGLRTEPGAGGSTPRRPERVRRRPGYLLDFVVED